MTCLSLQGNRVVDTGRSRLRCSHMAYSLTSVAKGATIYSIGQMFTKAAGFLLLPLYARFLTPKDFGIIGYLEVYIALMGTLMMFGFYSAQTRFYYDFQNNPATLGEFLFSVNLFLIVFLLLCCLLLTSFGAPLFGHVSHNDDVSFNPYFITVIWIIFFHVLNRMTINFYVAAKAYKATTALQLFQFFLITTGVVYFVVMEKEGAIGKFKGVLIGQAVFFVIFFSNYARRFRCHFVFKHVWNSLAYGFPVVLHLIASNLLLFIDRIILERYVPLSDLGIYTFGYQIGLVMGVLVTSINKAWAPSYFEMMNQKEIDHRYQVRKTFAVWLTGIGVACLVCSLWSKEILMLLMPEKFYPSARIVPIIVLSYVFEGVYYFAVIPFFYYKKTLYLPIFTGTVALLNIGLNLILIPSFGIYGAAYATLISHVVLSVCVYLLSRRFFNPQYEITKSLFLFLLLSMGLWQGFQQVTIAAELMKLALVGAFCVSSIMLFKAYLMPIVSDLKKGLLHVG